MHPTIDHHYHKINWIVLQCPIYGDILAQILEVIEQKPEPWRLHAKQCLTDNNILLLRTSVIIALNETEGLVGFVWLSNPDLSILYPWKAYSFIFHVYIKPKYRKLGIGSKGIELALSQAKAHESDGVLLATDNTHLKEGFYYNFGFRDVASDPWLMKKRFHANKKSKGYLDKMTPTLRSLSFHDLATVQSISAQPHWILRNEQIIRSGETEIEETFCGLFYDKQNNQFIISGSYLGNPFISWTIENNHSITQRILYKRNSGGELRIISSKVQAAVDRSLQMDNNHSNEASIFWNDLWS
jgi:GNAT superfamily N-acetyltransferase